MSTSFNRPTVDCNKEMLEWANQLSQETQKIQKFKTHPDNQCMNAWLPDQTYNRKPTYIPLRHQQQLSFPPTDPRASPLANAQATHQTVAINQNHAPSDGHPYL